MAFKWHSVPRYHQEYHFALKMQPGKSPSSLKIKNTVNTNRFKVRHSHAWVQKTLLKLRFASEGQNERPQCNKSTFYFIELHGFGSVATYCIYFWWSAIVLKPVTFESNDRHTFCANLTALERLLHIHSKNTCQRKTILNQFTLTIVRKTSLKKERKKT